MYNNEDIKLLKRMRELLIKAKKLVSHTGYSSYTDSNRLHRGLCAAINYVTYSSFENISRYTEAQYQLSVLIKKSLGNHTWFDSKLRSLDRHRYFTQQQVAKYRHKWIDQLIRDITKAIKKAEAN